jgi:hypothetical protein
MLERMMYALRKLAEFLRVVAVAATGAMYVVAKDMGHDVVAATALSCAVFFLLAAVAFVLDLITGEK